MARFRLSLQCLCIALLFAGAKFAVARERLRHGDLRDQYQQINRAYFSGQLPDAYVHWGHLENAVGQTYIYKDSSIRIALDLGSISSEEDVQETLRHESCHVKTFRDVQAASQDPHGSLFEACMTRFNLE
jgi:predicted SprT family Zn-dependent metalloprotease